MKARAQGVHGDAEGRGVVRNRMGRVGMVVVPEVVITGTNNRATESRGGRIETRAVVIVDRPVAAVIVAIDRVRIAERKSRFLRSRLRLYPMGKVWNPLRVRSS